MKMKSMLVGLAAVLVTVAAWAAGVVPGQQIPGQPPPANFGLETKPGAAIPTAPAANSGPAAKQTYTMPGAPAPSAPLPGTPSPSTAPPSAPTPSAPAPAPVSFPAAKELPTPSAVSATSESSSGRQESGVSLEWIGPNTARLGQPVVCQLVVKNISTCRVSNVTVRARIPDGVSVRGTEPKAATEDNHLVWNLGTLEIRQEKHLDVQVVPETKGSIDLPAFVTLTSSSTSRLEVREPKLELKASAPQRAVVGDPATVVLTVSNPGDAPAENVKVHAVLSEGLEHARGKAIDFDLDSIAPHENRTVLVLCSAKAAGVQRCEAIATAEPKLVAQDAATIDLVSPKLDVFAAGPGLRYLDRHAVLLLRVSNHGTAVAHNVTLTDHVPAGFKVVSAPGAQHDFVTRSVCWFLGELQPNQTREVNLELTAVNAGVHKNQVVATAAHGLRTEAEVVTHIEGLPALLMELADADDPVEVGANTSYQIRVTNTGTKSESNLQLVCAIPEQMKCLDARGPAGCTFKVEGQQVIFQPLGKLAPRADAIYRVYVHCLRPGDCRFRAQITAEGLSNPVLREESTRVYGDEGEGAKAAAK
jgi:uncharacterized repeat protein (TIGR01451 family)